MNRYFLICTFLFARLFADAQSNVGDSLFAAGDYLAARVAYERAIFSTNLIRDVNSLLFKKSRCFTKEEKFNEAYETLMRGNLFEGTDSVKRLMYYESILTSYLAGKYDLTLGRLKEARYYFPDINTRETDLIELLALAELHQWKESQEKHLAYCKIHQQKVDSALFTSIINFKPKNPRKAELLSMLVPGSGQVYAGYPLKGLMSLLLNGSLIYFSVYSFSNGYIWSGAFTGVGLFFFFYNGGAAYAGQLAEQRNAHTYQRALRKIREDVLPQ